MPKVIQMHKKKVEDQGVVDKFDFAYITNDENRITGVSHSNWPFCIQRSENGRGNEIALVSDDGEPFGALDREVFNALLVCWLLIDDPNAIATDK